MTIAYFAGSPGVEYWDGIWEGNELFRLIATARRDPMTSHLLSHLPAKGAILEGGCGLGQYVVLLRELGYRVFGGDFSLVGLHAHRLVYEDSPLLGLDLRRMPFASESLQGHISIGVVEHARTGPQELLREYYRTLVPGGTLLLSVPWVNGYRRVAQPWIQSKQNRLRAAGAEFYQYAFSRDEIERLLGASGFRVLAFYPYSPAKGLRELALFRTLFCALALRPSDGSRSRLPATGDRQRERARAERDTQGATEAAPSASPEGGQARKEERVVPPGGALREEDLKGPRRLLYWSPVLWAFAHMILVVAQRPA